MASAASRLDGRTLFADTAAKAASPPLWERVFIVVAVVVYATDGFRLVFPGEAEISFAYRLAHFAFYGAFAALILRRPQDALAGLARAPDLVLLLALPLLSVLWSINPQETAQRGVAVLGSSLLGLYLATQIERRVALHLFAVAFALSAVLSFVLIATVPAVGLSQEPLYPGAWAGAYGHKNGLGISAALGAFFCLLVVRDRGPRRSPVAAVGLVANVALLIGSQSVTGQLVLGLAVTIVFFAGAIIRIVAHRGGALAFAAVGAIVAGVLLASPDTLRIVVEAFGRDLTLSNRLPIWQAVWPFVEARPLLGYGYEAFWHDGNYAVRVIAGAVHFRPWYSHNGLLELMLGLGGLGVCVFAVVFLRFMGRAARLLDRNARDPVFLLAFVFGIVTIAHNASESTILLRNSFLWSLFVMLVLEVATENAAGCGCETPLPPEIRQRCTRHCHLTKEHCNDVHGQARTGHQQSRWSARRRRTW